VLDSIEYIIRELSDKELLTQKNVSDLRRFISIKYSKDTKANNASVFADAVKRILHIKLSEINKEYRNEIIQILLTNTVVKASFVINAQDVFNACLSIDAKKESFLDEVAQWAENLLDKPIVKEEIKRYAVQFMNKANASGDNDFSEVSDNVKENGNTWDYYGALDSIDAKENIIEQVNSCNDVFEPQSDETKNPEVAAEHSGTIVATDFQDYNCSSENLEYGVLCQETRAGGLNPGKINIIGDKLASLYKYLLLNRIAALYSFIQRNKPMLGKLTNVRVYGPAVIIVFTVVLIFGLMNSKNEASSKQNEAFNSSVVSDINLATNDDIGSEMNFFPYKMISRSELVQNKQVEEKKSDLLATNTEKRVNPINKIVSRSDKESNTSKKTNTQKN